MHSAARFPGSSPPDLRRVGTHIYFEAYNTERHYRCKLHVSFAYKPEAPFDLDFMAER